MAGTHKLAAYEIKTPTNSIHSLNKCTSNMMGMHKSVGTHIKHDWGAQIRGGALQDPW